MQRKQLGQKRCHQYQRLTRNCNADMRSRTASGLEAFWRTLKWDDDANTEPGRTASEDSFDNTLDDTMLERVNHIDIWSTSAVVSTSHAHGALGALQRIDTIRCCDAGSGAGTSASVVLMLLGLIAAGAGTGAFLSLGKC